MPLPAHIHDSYSSGLELRAHLLVVRVRSSQLVYRLKVAPSYAPDQSCHDYRAQSAWFNAKDSRLANTPIRSGSGKHWLTVNKYSKEAGVTPRRSQASPEMVLF